MILSGNWGHALSRLLKANSFPEFTGRVCPCPLRKRLHLRHLWGPHYGPGQ